MIRAVNVTKRFEDILVDDNISLDVPKGTILGMVGPNGAGKTTLVRMMIGILSPTSGSCYIEDTQSNRLSTEERASTGYMTQLKSLYSDLTARENLDFIIFFLIPYIFPLTYYTETAKAVAFYNTSLIDESIPVIILILHYLLGICASVVKRSEK